MTLLHCFEIFITNNNKCTSAKDIIHQLESVSAIETHHHILCFTFSQSASAIEMHDYSGKRVRVVALLHPNHNKNRPSLLD
jgi:hypothetical protein